MRTLEAKWNPEDKCWYYPSASGGSGAGFRLAGVGDCHPFLSACVVALCVGVRAFGCCVGGHVNGCGWGKVDAWRVVVEMQSLKGNRKAGAEDGRRFYGFAEGQSRRLDKTIETVVRRVEDAAPPDWHRVL